MDIGAKIYFWLPTKWYLLAAALVVLMGIPFAYVWTHERRRV